MKENNTFELAAVRIHYWFGRDKANLFHAWYPNTQECLKKYKCDLIKSYRIPSQIQHFPLHGYLMTRKKRQAKNHRHIIQEHFSRHCTISQKNINHLQPAKTLSSARIAYSRLKEHFLASKRLKNLSKQKHTPTKHHVVSFKASSSQENPYLKEWGKAQEERLFQVDRVIKMV